MINSVSATLPQQLLRRRQAKTVRDYANNKKLLYLTTFGHFKPWKILKLNNWLSSQCGFARPGKRAVPPRHNLLSWRTSLLCILVQLAGGGSVIIKGVPKKTRPLKQTYFRVYQGVLDHLKVNLKPILFWKHQFALNNHKIVMKTNRSNGFMTKALRKLFLVESSELF